MTILKTPTYRVESDVKKQVKKILDARGWFWWMPPANGYGVGGIADFNAVKNGTFLAIETKFGSNKPTALQIGFLNSIRAADGLAMVVNDKNIDWLDHFLESFEIASQATSNRQPVPEEHGARMLNAIAQLSNKYLDV